MKMNLKKLMEETDNGILDEIIGKAEKKMAEPFKKETVVAIAKPEMEEEEPEMEMEGEMGKESSIPEEDMAMLMELYAKIKGSKGE